jgi:hypothetical protein
MRGLGNRADETKLKEEEEELEQIEQGGVKVKNRVSLEDRSGHQ